MALASALSVPPGGSVNAAEASHAPRSSAWFSVGALRAWPQRTGGAKAFIVDHPVVGCAVALLERNVDQYRCPKAAKVPLLKRRRLGVVLDVDFIPRF